MSSSKVMRKLALVLLMSAATQVVAAPVSAANLDSLERMLEAQGQVQLQMQRRLEQMSSDIDDLRGNVERNSYEIKKVVARQRDIYREVDNLSRQPAKAEPTDANKEATSSEAFSSNTDENAAYEKAVNLILKEKDYKGATKAFQSFLTTYPNSVYKENASYWLGQLFFAQNQLADAATNFKIVADTKDSSKRADALVKLGVIAERGNDIATAKTYYQEVIKAYPNSTSANQAKTALTKLK